jgi:hypothetical protein
MPIQAAPSRYYEFKQGDLVVNTWRLEDMSDSSGAPENLQPSTVLTTWNGPMDPGNPRNWPTKKKCFIAVIYAAMTFSYTFSSSVLSAASAALAEEYDVSYTVATLGLSLFAVVS